MLDSVHFSARFLSKLIVVVVEASTLSKNTEICPERRSLNTILRPMNKNIDNLKMLNIVFFFQWTAFDDSGRRRIALLGTLQRNSVEGDYIQ